MEKYAEISQKSGREREMVTSKEDRDLLPTLDVEIITQMSIQLIMKHTERLPVITSTVVKIKIGKIEHRMTSGVSLQISKTNSILSCFVMSLLNKHLLTSAAIWILSPRLLCVVYWAIYCLVQFVSLPLAGFQLCLLGSVLIPKCKSLSMCKLYERLWHFFLLIKNVCSLWAAHKLIYQVKHISKHDMRFSLRVINNIPAGNTKQPYFPVIDQQHSLSQNTVFSTDIQSATDTSAPVHQVTFNMLLFLLFSLCVLIFFLHQAKEDSL